MWPPLRGDEMRWWQIRKRDADLERELESDLELEEEEQRERGLSAEEAHHAARRAFGNTTLIKEQTYEAREWARVERLLQDLRFAVRTLLRNRCFAARTFWPNQDAIGKRLKFGGTGSPSPWSRIVGIVGDVRQVDLSLPPGPEMFFPHWQALDNYMTPHALAVQTEGNPMGMADALRHAIHSVDAEQPADDIFPLDDLIDTDVTPRRMQAALIGSLALLALVIASVGIYGVMAYLVSQRTQEMGIRTALGAQRADVLLLVLWRGARITLAGLAVGICAAAALTRLMQSLLFEVSPADPAIFAAVSVLLLLVALIACVVPASRAASVDPMSALRSE
jgi:hypothetical protein